SLATDLASDVPWPVTDRSAMDGFAIAAPADVDAGARFVVVGESLAGHPFDGPLKAGAAIRIMTGAVVPRGATVVVPVERTGGFVGGEVVVDAVHPLGAHIRRAGSELAVGEVVTHAGTRIDPATIGVLAVLGI